jgi:hypothetical protein
LNEYSSKLKTIRQLLLEGVPVGHILSAVEEVGFFAGDRPPALIPVRPEDVGPYKSEKRSQLKAELCQWIRDAKPGEECLANQEQYALGHCGWPHDKLPRFDRLRELWRTDALIRGEDADFDQRHRDKEKPKKRSRRQEEAIIAWLTDNGFDPQALPLRGPKSAACDALLKNPELFTESAFVHAWDRLRATGAIRNRAK